MIKLDERLSAAASLIRPGSRICDVGTDHAKLACRLWQQGERRITACDINEGPLAAARETVAEYGCEGIELVRSDGLLNVPPCDDIVIAGMGGELIARIVLECPFTDENTRFILQPMTKDDVLRRKLCSDGFEIVLEKGAVSAGKAYTVMLVRFTGIKQEISAGFAYFGKNDHPEYIKKVNNRLRKLGRGDSSCLGLIREAKERDAQ